MIAYITGSIIQRWEQVLIVQTHGIGYYIQVPDEQAFAKDDIALWVYAHWSQDQGMTLFGFSDQSERELFSILLEASGVGPRLALQCLKALSVHELVTALSHEDAQTLSRIPGIGAQKAKKIAFHVKDKAQAAAHRITTSDASTMQMFTDVRAALTSLGYGRHEIDHALSSIPVSHDDRFDTVLRKALSQLSK